MNRFVFPLAAGLAILVVLVFVYSQRQPPAVKTLDLPEETGRQPSVAQTEEAEIRYPVPESVPQREDQPKDTPSDPVTQTDSIEEVPPLPALDESDAHLKEAVGAFVTEQSLDALLRMDGFVRRLVVTIDNLSRKQLPRGKYRVTRPTAGRFGVAKEGDSLYLSPDNFDRYTPIVELMTGLEIDQLITVYLKYYPLFQEAYEYLGYPSSYFNDRLIDVVDHLLAAPVVDGPIGLVRPHVLYRYADPELEGLSAGHKILIRVGPANADKMKAKLREVRQALTGQAEAEQLGKEIEKEIESLIE